MVWLILILADWSIYSVDSLHCHHSAVALRVASLKSPLMTTKSWLYFIEWSLWSFNCFELCALCAWIIYAELSFTVWMMIIWQIWNAFAFRTLFEICIHICLLLWTDIWNLLYRCFWRPSHYVLWHEILILFLSIYRSIRRLPDSQLVLHPKEMRILTRQLIQLKLLLLIIVLINRWLIKMLLHMSILTLHFLLFTQNHGLILIKRLFQIIKVFFLFIKYLICCLIFFLSPH